MAVSSRTVRAILALGAFLAALGAVAPGSSAVTWHNSGDTAFTATAGALVLHGGTLVVSCVNTTLTGATGVTGATPTTWTAAHGTLTATCLWGTSPSWRVHCTYTFTATSQLGSVTSGTFSPLCSISASGYEICKLEGSTPMIYVNPASGAAGRFTEATSTSLRFTDGANPSGPIPCIFGTGAALTHETTFGITAASGGPAPHLGPVLTRTA